MQINLNQPAIDLIMVLPRAADTRGMEEYEKLPLCIKYGWYPVYADDGSGRIIDVLNINTVSIEALRKSSKRYKC